MPAQKEALKGQNFDSIQQIRDIIVGEELAQLKNQIRQLQNECEQLKNQLAVLEKKLDTDNQLTTQNLENLTASTLDRQQIYSLLDEIKKDIENKFSDLNEKKVDKSQIGEVFIQWGMKVKQTNI